MAVPARVCSGPPWWCWHYGMRAVERTANHYCSVLRGVSDFTMRSDHFTNCGLSQPFWGNMVAAAGAGPQPILQKQLDSTNLAEAIRFCLTPEASQAAMGLAEKMAAESGVRRAVASFHANLPLHNMRCDIFPNRPATWALRKGKKNLKLSKAAAGIFVDWERLEWKDLKTYDTKPFDIELRRWDPVTGLTSSLIGTSAGMVGSAVDIFAKPVQAYHRPSTSRASSLPGSPRRSITDDDALYGRSAALDLPSPTPTGGGPPSQSTNHFGKAAKGSVKGIGGFFKHATKGMYLDMPLAVAEGMRNAPQLYGGEVYNPGAITDWKSGGIAAGKNFTHGIIEGLGGVVTTPMREGKKNGAAGYAKGTGVGLLNAVTKFSSGALGLVAFTGQGLYKSIYSATHHSTKDLVKLAKVEESQLVATMEEADGKKEYALKKYGEILAAKN